MPSVFTPHRLAAAAACVFIAQTSLASSLAPQSVGEITFVIGASRIVSGSGSVAPVVRGMPVHVSDRIETTEGGHALVRFVDGATVSVRPNSRLHIETYQFDAAQPHNSAIRLQLEEGVARSVTGKGGEAAKDRFRLNTPIAAIGVKGTDFIVSANEQSVRVAVQSGAVVVSPFGTGCRADALGPCATDGARTLSADMGSVMLELQRQQNAPRLLPAPGPDMALARSGKGEVVVAASEAPTVLPIKASDPAAEARAMRTVSTLVVDEPPQSLAQTPVPTPAPAPVEKPTTPVTVAPEPPPTVVAAVPDPVVVTPVVPEPVVVVLPPATMVWGRWSWTAPQPGTTTVSYEEAIQGGRKSTVGNTMYALFRPEPAGLFVMPSQLGRVEFTLRDAEAQFTNKLGKTEAALVSGGSLGIDFSASKFSTTLSFSNSTVGSFGLQAGGSIRDDGIFSVTTTDGKVAGAVTADGKEAGYLFEKLTPVGTFNGLTRWGR